MPRSLSASARTGREGRPRADRQRVVARPARSDGVHAGEQSIEAGLDAFAAEPEVATLVQHEAAVTAARRASAR